MGARGIYITHAVTIAQSAKGENCRELVVTVRPSMRWRRVENSHPDQATILFCVS